MPTLTAVLTQDSIAWTADENGTLHYLIDQNTSRTAQQVFDGAQGAFNTSQVITLGVEGNHYLHGVLRTSGGVFSNVTSNLISPAFTRSLTTGVQFGVSVSPAAQARTRTLRAGVQFGVLMAPAGRPTPGLRASETGGGSGEIIA